MARVDRIISLIKQKGLTQTFVCEKLGAKRGKIGDWARGKSTPKPCEIAVLSELLGVSEDYLSGQSIIYQEEGGISIGFKLGFQIRCRRSCCKRT